MDGITANKLYIESIRCMADNMISPAFTKMMAIDEIKCQPFYGDYCKKRVTIRRPVRYKSWV